MKQTSAPRENVSGEYIVQQTVRNARAPGPKYKPNKNGYFGRKGDSGNNYVRHLPGGKVAAEKFFNEMTKGYTLEKQIYYKDGRWKGTTRFLPNGGIVNYRPVSNSDGTPAVQLDNGTFKYQRIHFIEE